jgi:hypothetical protein
MSKAKVSKVEVERQSMTQQMNLPCCPIRKSIFRYNNASDASPVQVSDTSLKGAFSIMFHYTLSFV